MNHKKKGKHKECIVSTRMLNMKRKFKRKYKAHILDIQRGYEKRIQDILTKTNTHSTCLPSTNAIIYKSELEFVSRCILDRTNIETGGQMFGYWTEDGTPIVLYTIGPGLRANHQSAFFNQDLNYLENIGNILTQKYGLQHIGEWHSHHQLGLAHPSGHDASTMANGLRSSNRNRFLLCIGNCTSILTKLKPFNFVAECGTQYTDATWIVKNIDSPFRTLIDNELRNMLVMPNTRQANYEGMEIIGNTPTIEAKKPSYNSAYWLSNKENNIVLKNIIDFLNQDSNVSDIKPMLDGNRQEVNLTFSWRREYQTIISFIGTFPHEAPQYKVYKKDWRGETTNCKLKLPNWKFEGDILKAFIDYYNNIRLYDGQR